MSQHSLHFQGEDIGAKDFVVERSVERGKVEPAIVFACPPPIYVDVALLVDAIEQERMTAFANEYGVAIGQFVNYKFIKHPFGHVFLTNMFH